MKEKHRHFQVKQTLENFSTTEMHYKNSQKKFFRVGRRSPLSQRRLRPRTVVTSTPSTGELALGMTAGWSRRHRAQPRV